MFAKIEDWVTDELPRPVECDVPAPPSLWMKKWEKLINWISRRHLFALSADSNATAGKHQTAFNIDCNAIYPWSDTFTACKAVPRNTRHPGQPASWRQSHSHLTSAQEYILGCAGRGAKHPVHCRLRGPAAAKSKQKKTIVQRSVNTITSTCA